MAIKKKYKPMKYYLNLSWNYSVSTEHDEKGNKIYIICVNELPGICSDGLTFSEAMESIQEAIEGVIRLYMLHNEEIPEPIDESKYKGNIAYRTTSRRHYLLAREAQRRGFSLSETLDACIDKALLKK